MNTNYEFNLTLRKGGTIKDLPKTYINVLNTFNHNENIVEINGNKHDITENQFNELKNLVEKNLTKLINISKEQTQLYLNEFGLDGYASNLVVAIGGLSICINFAVADKKTKEFESKFIESICKIFY